MEEDIKELLKRKDEYDFAYGTQVYRPYSMSEKDWELIENLLTKYKELKEENKELREEECCMTTCLRKDKEKVFIENKIKEKIEELENKVHLLTHNSSEYEKMTEFKTEGAINVLQELLEEE